MAQLTFQLSVFLLMLFFFPLEGMISGSSDHIQYDEMVGFDLGPVAHMLNAQRTNIKSNDHFIENLGQLDNDDIQYYSTGSLRAGLTETGIIYACDIVDKDLTCAFKMTFLDQNKPILSGKGNAFTRYHYFKGGPANLTMEVNSYYEVVYKELYHGTNLKFSFMGDDPKYELMVGPGIGTEHIAFKFEGARTEIVDNGHSLRIQCGPIIFIDGPLRVMQDGNELCAKFIERDGNIGFWIGDHDPSKSLIIDPVLTASTYLGGNNWDKDASVVLGNDGNILIAGTTESTDFPTHFGAYDRVQNGERDLFISKLSSDLTSVMRSTFIGGTMYESFGDITMDGTGNILITGYTNSTDLPTTPNAYGKTFYGGPNDAFAIKFDPDLTSLKYSTYLGGDGADNGMDIATNSSGYAYIFGRTESDDLPIGPGAYQNAMKGESDCFLMLLAPNGSSMEGCTYLGGDSWGEIPYALELNSSGSPIMAGHTISNDFPTTPGAFKTEYGSYMGFVTGLSNDLSELTFSTFLANGTWIHALDIGPDDSIYLTGRTVPMNTPFPTTPMAYDTVIEGEEEVFMSRLTKNGSALISSTLLGANEKYGADPYNSYFESGSDIAVDDDGRAFICGMTDSTYFPLTIDAFDKKRNEREAFVSIISSNATILHYSTFLGGSDEDLATGLCLGTEQTLFLVGETYSNYLTHNFPTTENSYDRTFNGMYDLFATSFKLDSFVPDRPTNVLSVSGNAFVDLRWDPPIFDGNEEITYYRIYRGTLPKSLSLVGSTTASVEQFNDTSVTNGRTYHYEIRAVNKVGEGLGASALGKPMTVPTEPRIYNIYEGGSYLNISWFPPDNNGGSPVLNYSLYSGMDNLTLGMAVSNIERTWYNLSGLIKGQEYFFSITAINIVGEGARSPVMSGIPRSVPSEPLEPSINLSDKSIELRWKPPADHGGSPKITYNIYTGRNVTSMELAISSLNVTYQRITGLINGLTYYIVIKAQNIKGEGPPTPILSGMPLGPVSSPWNLSAREGGDHVNLTWLAPLELGGGREIIYTVHYGTRNDTLDNTIDNFTSTKAIVKGLSQGVEYFFAVSARNGIFESQWSEVVRATPLNLPTNPLDVYVIVHNKALELYWKKPIDDGGDRWLTYEVYNGMDMGSPSFMGSTTLLTMNITGLKNGENYTLAVKAVNRKGPGPFSDPVLGIPMTLPSAPLNLRYIEGNGSLDFTWDSPYDLGGAREVNFSLFFGSSEDTMKTIAADIDGNHYLVNDLENGMVYYAAVSSRTSYGTSPMSDIIEAIPMTYPIAPSSFIAVFRDNEVMISFQPPSSNGGGPIWLYHIYRGSSMNDLKLLASLNPSTLVYEDTTIEEGQTYFYAVRAENPHGKGPMAGPVEVNTASPIEKRFEFYWILAAVATVIMFLTIIAVFVYLRRRNRGKKVVFEE